MCACSSEMATQNGTTTELSLNETKPTEDFDVMEIIQLSIAPVGIIANLTVVVVFLNNKKLRHKIPNRIIVNQVRF